MTITLLLDLDNTLLGNDMDRFLPAYFSKLSKVFPQWAKESFIQKLLAATELMLRKNQPRQTLEQTFDAGFYPALQVKKEEVLSSLNAFYTERFPELQSYTQVRPEAIHLVERAFDAGYQLVVATNPIFPIAAQLHRLQWAGLPLNKYPFSLVTSFETLHFAKPNPAYYAEILAQAGYPEQPAVMVGDNLADDLIPAAKIGIPGFLVTDKPVDVPTNLPAPIVQGKLAEVWPWLKKIEMFKETSPAPEISQTAILAALKATPAALETLSKDLTAQQWMARPTPTEWSAVEMLCHLRDADAEVNLPRLNRLLAEDVPFIAGISTDPWAEERDYLHQNGPASAAGFMEVRTQITELLTNLPADGWTRTARHAIFGPTTLKELVGFITTHDTIHVRQIFETLRKIR